MSKAEDREKVLVVDDEEGMRLYLRDALQKVGYEVVLTSSGEEALEEMRRFPYKVVVTDIRMPGMSGLDALEEMSRIREHFSSIVITAHGQERMPTGELGKVTVEYLTKPFELSKIRESVARAIGQTNTLVGGDFLVGGEIVGTGMGMTRVREMIATLADTDVTILIQGESGTGKELVARAIHREGARANRPFVGLNCSAIPETLLESELFGHEKGAFTGAESAKPGKFELAEGGTLFLDEVSDMSLFTQAKLLRVLQEKEYVRVGGTGPVQVDVRIIAATHKNLEAEVEKGNFRGDLFYRLSVVPLRIPSLRDRREDIPQLLDHLISQYNGALNRRIHHITLEAVEVLMNYDWPGNVRELENVLQQAIVLAKCEELGLEDLPDLLRKTKPKPGLDLSNVDPSRPLREMLEDVVAQVEKRAIAEALGRVRGSRTRAAEELGISRKSLHNKMKKYNLFEKGDEDNPENG
ncbi:MAG: sigma-54-dependent Fis family transcriptional regulator [Candidatus Omnitrophica bacterium]|nr:sigma-54-dependent Fis family transcriptional regulator [Candidatus Omnitrophota bacterium]